MTKDQKIVLSSFGIEILKFPENVSLNLWPNCEPTCIYQLITNNHAWFQLC